MTLCGLEEEEEKDFRRRYLAPIHWTLDPYSHFGIDYEGYVSVVLSMLPEGPLKILDAGCGDGFITKQVIEKGHSACGVDYSRRAIEFAKIYVPEGEFYQGDLRDLTRIREISTATFDLVLMVETLEHIPPEAHRQVLRNVHNVLRPAGLIVISVPSNILELNRWHYKHFSLEEIRQLLDTCGFNCEQIIGQNRRSVLFSHYLWKVISNDLIDLVFVRQILRKCFLRHFNRVKNLRRANRFIIVGRKN